MAKRTMENGSEEEALPANVEYSKRSRVAILIPVYCEADNIEIVIRNIEKLQIGLHITVIDDSSPDGTLNIVEKLKEEFENLQIVSRNERLGLGSAITAGFKHILKLEEEPDYIVTMDADQSHNPRDIPRLIDAAKSGYDLVIGSRYCKGGEIVGSSWQRIFISRLANFLAKIAIGTITHDFTSGFRCYSSNFARSILQNLRSRGYEIQVESVSQAKIKKLKIKEIPITFVNRKRGNSKLSFSELPRFIKCIIRTNLTSFLVFDRSLRHV